MARHDRATAYPRAVERQFSDSWPGFAELDARYRAHFSLLLCSAFRLGRYAHSVYEDAITYGYRARDAAFGRGHFPALNRKLGLLDVLEHWQQGDYTKGYRLTDEALCLMEAIPLKTTTLVDVNGTEMRTPAQLAISERDIKENHRKGHGNLPAVVLVDIDAMLNLLEEARAWRWHYKDERQPPQGRRLAARMAGLKDNKTRVEWLTKHLIMPLTLTSLRADTAAMPRGRMEITYTEFPSGRLYSVAGVMQTVPREIRSAAMSGYWDYDIENCHYSLMAQLATKAGIETPAIDDYLNRKREIRETLAKEFDVPLAAIKEALLALIYGAPRRAHSYYKNGRKVEPAFVNAVGADKAAALFNHPLFAGLHYDLSKARMPILESMPVNRKWRMNPFGKGISQTERPARQLAHIVQGAEALILDTVIQRHGPDLRLLMHDGWVSAVPLDTADLERHIETVTGFRVSLEQKRL